MTFGISQLSGAGLSRSAFGAVASDKGRLTLEAYR